jgi:TatA/E family protein of Tat protein translocase
MLDLSPAKLLVIVIVAVILLGPDKLPQVARQVGAAWRKLRDFQQRVDQEVRQNVPDLPSTQEIARFARSPMTVLNRWAAMDELVEDPAATDDVVADGDAWPEDRAGGPEPIDAVPIDPEPTGVERSAAPSSARPVDPTQPTGVALQIDAVPVDDPGMN